MVTQTISEAPIEAPIEKQSMESTNYIVIKNHVREIKEPPVQPNTTELQENSEKSVQKRKHELHKQSESSEEDHVNTEAISKSDIEELKSVYKKCKAVLGQFESKYGHILNLNDENECSSANKRKIINNACEHKCKCAVNKKTIFTDDGQPISEPNFKTESRVCPKKFKMYEKFYKKEPQNIQIEYENLYNSLPESIKELTEILKDPFINNVVRNKVVEKIKYLRNENLNMIKFDKESIIKKIKSNPEEIIDFKGANISSLQGYPIDKIVKQ